MRATLDDIQRAVELLGQYAPLFIHPWPDSVTLGVPPTSNMYDPAEELEKVESWLRRVAFTHEYPASGTGVRPDYLIVNCERKLKLWKRYID